jgi:hypothetical protein
MKHKLMLINLKQEDLKLGPYFLLGKVSYAESMIKSNYLYFISNKKSKILSRLNLFY